jgi:hypothetical protein
MVDCNLLFYLLFWVCRFYWDPSAFSFTDAEAQSKMDLFSVLVFSWVLWLSGCGWALSVLTMVRYKLWLENGFLVAPSCTGGRWTADQTKLHVSWGLNIEADGEEVRIQRPEHQEPQTCLLHGLRLLRLEILESRRRILESQAAQWGDAGREWRTGGGTKNRPQGSTEIATTYQTPAIHCWHAAALSDSCANHYWQAEPLPNCGGAFAEVST